MKKTALIFMAALFTAIPAFAKISFGTPSINENDEVLFTIKQDTAGVNPYKTLFYVQLKDGNPVKAPVPLTVYPEQMERLDNNTILQIRNRYGTARYSALTEKLTWTSASDILPVNVLPACPYSVSPDGKYICRVEKTGICSGSLVVQSVTYNNSVVVCHVPLNSYEDVAVKWSPDSSILLYENQGTVYFCNPDAILRGVEIDEKYRKIGRGTINSVCWTSSKYLAYIDDCILYKINSKELYTLGLYSGIIGQGTPMGRLPFSFDPCTDYFSSNGEVNGIVVAQNNKLFTYLRTDTVSLDYMDVVYSRPYTDSKASLVKSYVFWTDLDTPVLWQEKLPYDGSAEKAAVYKLDVKTTRVLEIQDSGRPQLSPDGSKVAFYSGSTIYVYDINTWQRVAQLDGDYVVSCVWANRNVLYVGGAKTIRKWSLISGATETITLSSAEKAIWDENGSIVSQVKEGTFNKYSFDRGTWKVQTAEPISTGTTQNGRYRVFTGTTSNAQFENALYVRILNRKAVTKAVFQQSVQKSNPSKKVALVFDAYDNTDGLSRILSALKRYNVPATFFLNGEFIRRFPEETKQIVASGYNCGSMFFSSAELTDDSFVIDEDFVRRGLARNEDEFFLTTKNELSLYWHAPYYSVTPQLIEYGQKAGYTYVNSLQSVNDGDLNTIEKPETLIQNYCNTIKKTGSGIVPVAVGHSLGKNNQPLYNNLDLLICALLDSGYEFTTVEEL